MCMKVPEDIKSLVDDDINDDEFDNIHVPCEDNLNNYVIKYVIPEVFCFTLANSFSRGALCEASLIQHYNSMTDVVLITTDIESIRPLIDDILHIKYNLTITNENPLVLEKWQ